MADQMIASTKRTWLPKRGFFAHFVPRKKMMAGHPTTKMKVPANFPPISLPIDWTKNGSLAFPIDGNDYYGDCMYAAACHADNTFTGNVGTESSFAAQTIIRDYLLLSRGDNGLDEGTLIQQWKQGLCDDAAVSILDALDVDPTNPQIVQYAAFLFGGFVFMLDVPDKWVNEFDTGVVWDAPAKADGNNGHGVWCNGVDTNGNTRVQTWGTSCWLTPAGIKVCDPSAFVVFSLRWFGEDGYAPNGLHYDQLAALWQQVGGKTLPPWQGPPPVPTPPPPGPTPTPAPIPNPPPIPAGGVFNVAGTLTLTPADSKEGIPPNIRPFLQQLLELLQQFINPATLKLRPAVAVPDRSGSASPGVSANNRVNAKRVAGVALPKR